MKFFVFALKRRVFMYKAILTSLLFVFFISSCATTNTKKPDLSQIKMFSTHEEIVKECPNDKMITIDPKAHCYKGYSTVIFGSKEEAKNKGVAKAIEAKLKYGLVGYYEKTLYLFGGPVDNYVFQILPIEFTELNSNNLLNEIESWIYAYRETTKTRVKQLVYLYELAKKDEFAELADTYKQIIKKCNTKKLCFSLGMEKLVDLYAFHQGSDSIKTLIQWIKYHEEFDVRRASYDALINMRKILDVEKLLTTEKNRDIKKAVKRKLIGL